MSNALPRIRSEVPGPESRAWAERLDAVECPEVTAIDSNVVVWDKGTGTNLFDVDGNRYVDLLAGFGTACLGHASPKLAEVTARQSRLLVQAHSDVYPARQKIELLEDLQRLLPSDLGWGILSASGSDAVESALKTAARVTKRSGVVAFEGAYHGLGLGALDATHRNDFRAPFHERLPHRTKFAGWGDVDGVRRALETGDMGAILFEPIQGRGGMRPAPDGFLAELRAIADRYEVLLIADEVYTGLGRSGRWLACEHDAVQPDVVALGKALGGGFPISVCVGRQSVMKRWGASEGEALHTSTHLGNPLGCAIAREVLHRIEQDKLVERAERLGKVWKQQIENALSECSGVVEVRGRGLMLGIELSDPARAQCAVGRALRDGWLIIGEGVDGRVLSLTPPLTIAEDLLGHFARKIPQWLT